MLVTIRGFVSKLKKQGKPLAETIAASPTAAYDAKWGQFLMTPAIFTKLVYSGVSFGIEGNVNERGSIMQLAPHHSLE